MAGKVSAHFEMLSRYFSRKSEENEKMETVQILSHVLTNKKYN
jgi:DTW domain-containing protein YfiP